MRKQPVEIRNPQDQDHDNHTIQNRFDLSLHWDEPVYDPQEEPGCDNGDDDGGKRHVVLSNLFSNSSAHREGLEIATACGF